MNNLWGSKTIFMLLTRDPTLKDENARSFVQGVVMRSLISMGPSLEPRDYHICELLTGLYYESYVTFSTSEAFATNANLPYAQNIFARIERPTLFIYNVMIKAHVRSGGFRNALYLFDEMRAANLLPDEATVVSTLSACTALKNLDLGREIYEYVSTRLGFTMIIGNALLDMFAKCGCLDMARGIFDDMQVKNVICWTSMVSAYVNAGNLDEARALFERSPVRDLVLWTTIINGYVQFNKVDEAMALFRNMQMERVKPDKYTLVALLTGCAQLGALEQGEWIHSYLEENFITIDAVVGTALIEMYAKCGLLEKSLQIFYNLNHKDTASWTSIICALAMNGDTTRALQLYSEMIQIGIQPDDITFIGVLSACSHGGLVEEGRRHFDSMTKIHQIEPKLEHYGCLIDLFGRFGLLDEAEEIITRIPNKDNKIIVPLYGALLSACRNYENVDMGERIAKRLVEIECGESSSHTLLANIYASSSRWEDVTRVRKKMTTKKSPGCSAVEVTGNVH
ncbi:hypothetical protein BUALT_Bualt15G0093500 [Buddleja alternifolia]|uniref:Pentatricopeptide repeat-containing protein n=1 Tax=Buddleja alternifolia TaxID=168488 RepID=A0AAV6WFP8_9LAMI|nr:hypothetical protein BUALT_Bualt15G0093500 [Buddleja alternifolia]